MGIYTSQKSLEKALQPYRQNGTIGFVPTMGALHRGHLELVRRALDENTAVVVSIFVNPTQFDNPTDLDKYPRTLDHDVALLNGLGESLLVFAPTAEELYQDNVKSRSFNFNGLDSEMEGKHRTGHFDGVGTVVSLLLNLVKPARAYFGEKDYQQLQIVKRLVEDEKLPITVVGCPIVRERNGLALSSRNKRLTNEQFEAASLIYRTLCEVRDNFATKTIEELHQMVTERFLNSTALTLEYFEIANETSLQPVRKKTNDGSYRAFIAAYAGEIRLIDNMALN
jgi:pantoate--beta-alanine ligase